MILGYFIPYLDLVNMGNLAKMYKISTPTPILVNRISISNQKDKLLATMPTTTLSTNTT
jgi:hypothetical protein